MSVKKKRKKSLNSNTSSSSYNDLDPTKLPLHVAVIMDGNGRWAKKRFLNRIQGHEKGSETVRTIVRTCREIGIPYLTLYAFSTENWQRPQSEVVALMALLKKFLESEKKEMVDNNIRLYAIGQIERLPESVRQKLHNIMALTKNNNGMTLNLALSYGGRAEIVRMVKEIAIKAKDDRIDPDSITPETISEHLYTRQMPDPDLLIRTSGEMRISNFLLWQIAYSEIHITDTLWPDFGKDEFVQILKDYQQRERRFGKV
ncbi:MAG: isoprenyl transferase [Deltaproteobacteria bacterium]|nr:isoprenyl transferase [Deltaproteobacteria bacterium]OQY13494.1 MAG: isoprenyl transferase [Desulfobacteraceae bacterium 4572_187]MBW1957436.1 isoprenyl transferase [Deltaproteobacteria bacterium]MBW2013268.1 isoprenyl transferase [Deltaproteobacteria bacterium]MBW2089705.1 isoprenyl transferase [Deltaproteobacteria bacterium]